MKNCKLIFFFTLLMYQFLTVNLNAQCGGTGVLDKGWKDQPDTNSLPLIANHNEFGIVDNQTFIIKIGDYPPFKSFPGPELSQGICTGYFYQSFDLTVSPNLPIPYRLEPNEPISVRTYRFENGNFLSGSQVTVTPPYSQIDVEPDFLMNYNGSMHAIEWDTSDYPWENCVSTPQPYSPEPLSVNIIAPTEIANGNSEVLVADIHGGSGYYEIEWSVKNLSNGNVSYTTYTEPENFFKIDGVKYYWYENEYKYDLLMPADDIEIEVTITDKEDSSLPVSDTKVIQSLPAPVTFINNVQETEDYGYLILNENKNDPIPSGDNRGLILDSDYTIRTDELPFIADFNGTSQKHHRWEAEDEEIQKLTHSFDFQTNTARVMEAMFNETKPATIKTIIDGHPVEGVNLQFRDPWHYYKEQTNWYQSDSLRSYSSPFKLFTSDTSQYGGVFSDQDPDLTSTYYSVSISPTQTINYNNRNHKIYFSDWTHNGKADFEDAALTTTPVVFTDGGAEVYANQKGSRFSNTLDAYKGWSQRKLAQNSIGETSIVYESMGQVWGEVTDGSTTWTFLPNEAVEPISSGEAKLPSIAVSNSSLIIVYQEYNEGSSDIVLHCTDAYSYAVFSTVRINTSVPYSFDMTPVVDFSSDGEVMVVWRESTSLKYKVYPITNDQIGTANDSGVIPNTFSSSQNPSIAGRQLSVNRNEYYIVWQHATNSIKYIEFETYNGNSAFSGYSTVSYNSGYDEHWNPEIIIHNDIPHVAWVGKRFESDDEEPGPIQTKVGAFGGGGFGGDWKERALLRSKTSSWSTSPMMAALGSDVDDVVINNAGSEFFFAYYTIVGDIGSNYYTNGVRSSDLADIINVTTGGRHVVLSNASSISNMMWSSPALYDPSLSLAVLRTGGINTSAPKGSANDYLTSIGREGITSKDSIQFYFAFGEIYVDGQQVNFIDLPDSLYDKSPDDVNDYLYTEPFVLSDNSFFTYGMMCGLADSGDANIALSGNEFLNFRVELVDDQTTDVIGIYDNVVFNIVEPKYYSNKNYQVDVEGIGNKPVRLRMVINDNIEQSYSIGNITEQDSLLLKEGYFDLHYKGELLVKEYDLVQNYPNPFNPSTIIKYSIPKSGIVKLNVYDILGREVKMLVNEFQNDGRYEVKFNAANLASGVYIYRLKVNDYVNTKKMMLVK